MTTSSEENQDPSHHDFDELQSRRRPTWGLHSSNRHQTLQDALRQLETDNNGLTFEDIMHYIGAENREEVDSGDDDDDEPLEEKVERPWQPDTWTEPTLVRTPHNRPSDSNLSTNAPSTRASIRPYVERAALFMAGGSRSSVPSSASDLAETSSVKIIGSNEHEEEHEEDYEDQKDDQTEDDCEVSLLP